MICDPTITVGAVLGDVAAANRFAAVKPATAASTPLAAPRREALMARCSDRSRIRIGLASRWSLESWLGTPRVPQAWASARLSTKVDQSGRLFATNNVNYDRQTEGKLMATHSRKAPVQKAAAAVGAVFLLVGIAGFIPGLTGHHDKLMFAGHESGAMLLGLFQVSVLHNIVHLAFGVAGLVLARSWPAAKSFLVIGGLLYAVVGIYGLLVEDKTDVSNFLPVNSPDNVLHFALAVGMVGLGLGLGLGLGANRPVVGDRRMS
jgi:hypothetical protein